MTTEYTGNMNESATYWRPPIRDAFDVQTFSAPVEVAVRWEYKAVMFRDPNGQEAVSNAVVYTAQQVEIGGYLFLGVSAAADPRSVVGAAEIRQIGRTMSLRATKRLNKAML